MAYQMYRSTTLGITLQESLDELIQNGSITPQLALRVMTCFDRCINRALAGRVKARLNFKAGQLETYRLCDNVWTLVMRNVEFREVQEVATVDKLKIVACDGRAVQAASGQPPAPGAPASGPGRGAEGEVDSSTASDA